MIKRFRMWLADLISGGELTAVAGHRDLWVMMCDNERQQRRESEAKSLAMIERLETIIHGQDENLYKCDVELIELRRVASDRREALKEIIGCETPGANGTVKRMVRIARRGLE